MTTNHHDIELELTSQPTSSASKLQEVSPEIIPPTFCHKLLNFYMDYQFLIHIALAILLALAHPPFGNEYVAAEYTSEWIAVIAIFVMQGLSLKLSELSQAVRLFKFNIFVQLFNLVVIPVVVFGFSRLLLFTGLLI